MTAMIGLGGGGGGGGALLHALSVSTQHAAGLRCPSLTVGQRCRVSRFMTHLALLVQPLGPAPAGPVLAGAATSAAGAPFRTPWPTLRQTVSGRPGRDLPAAPHSARHRLARVSPWSQSRELRPDRLLPRTVARTASGRICAACSRKRPRRCSTVRPGDGGCRLRLRGMPLPCPGTRSRAV